MSLSCLTGFEPRQQVLLIAGGVLLAAGMACFHLKKGRLPDLFLFAGAFVTAFLIASSDPFLNLWDEKFHALAAKNAMKNPLKPALYETPLLDYDYKDWSKNHVWLHKQPLFLWQIALSLKIFGINELAVRLPSVLMYALAALMTYRIGRIAATPKIGYYGGVLLACAFFPLQFIAGRNASDHNDIAFLFYVTGSLWTWFQYRETGKNIYLYLIGAFSGGAILVKWLTGLLVYAVWGVSGLIGGSLNFRKFSDFAPMFRALTVTVLIAAPWQIFTLINYPREALYEMKLSSDHFWHVIEGHGGDALFHFSQLAITYRIPLLGDLMPWVMGAGFAVLLFSVRTAEYRAALLTAVGAVYTFFTLAATKMGGFTLIMIPFGFMSLSALICAAAGVVRRFEKRRTVASLIVGIGLTAATALSLFQLCEVQLRHTEVRHEEGFDRQNKLRQIRVAHLLEEVLGDGDYAVFNTDQTHAGYVTAMFYGDKIVYGGIPRPEQIKKVKESGYIPVVGYSKDEKLPDYITGDDEVIKLDLSPADEPKGK